jgi:hypothetical protein
VCVSMWISYLCRDRTIDASTRHSTESNSVHSELMLDRELAKGSVAVPYIYDVQVGMCSA